MWASRHVQCGYYCGVNVMAKPPTINERLIQLYQQMYELTEPECRLSCRCPQSCCSPEYCEATIQGAQEQWNTTLVPTDHEKLLLMGPKGCVAAPHLRPMCTLHTCDMMSFAAKVHPAPDPKWNRTYWKIRNEISRLESVR
mgnify:FL=1